MGIFDWWRRSTQRLDAENVSEELIREATDYAIKIANPHLAVVRRYRERLALPIEATIVYLRGFRAAFLPAREATPAGWNADPAMRAFFASPDDLIRALSRSNELRDFFEQAPELDEACAVLGMAAIEQKVLGMRLHGDVVQRDVAQTTLSFADYKVRIIGRNEPELRYEIGRRVFEQLALRAIETISGIKSRARELENQRALLKARLKLLQRQSAGMKAMVADALPSEAELRKIETKLEKNENELNALALGPRTLERELECLIQTLNEPDKTVSVSKRRVRLDSMNVIVEDNSTEQSREIEFNVFELAGTPPLRRAFSLVRFPRTELLPRDFMRQEAERSLGR